MHNILVIDDEKGVSAVIREALNMFGHEVEIASDGQEGIQKFDTQPFDLVITDIQMPGKDGNSVARHIRNSTKRLTPIIGISGTPWFLEEGEFDMVFSKPFPLQRLIESIQTLPSLNA